MIGICYQHKKYYIDIPKRQIWGDLIAATGLVILLKIGIKLWIFLPM